jgi:hypothetical protein
VTALINTEVLPPVNPLKVSGLVKSMIPFALVKDTSDIEAASKGIVKPSS